MSLCFSGSLVAQVNVDKQESQSRMFRKEITSLTINSDVLFTGERLRYKVYSLTDSKKPSYLSRIAYISLRSQSDTVIFTHKVRMKDATAWGSFFIPGSLPTGAYTLISYTNPSLNARKGVSTRGVVIINPHGGQDDRIGPVDSSRFVRLELSGRTKLEAEPTLNDTFLSLRTDRSSYGRRDRITVVLEDTVSEGGVGNYALSVRRVAPIRTHGTSDPCEYHLAGAEDVLHIPELRGELLTGVVTTRTDNIPVPGKLVAISIPSRHAVFRVAKTRKDGRFFLSIDQAYESGQAVVQVCGEDRHQYQVAITPRIIRKRMQGCSTQLIIDPNTEDWIQNRSAQIQIQNAYFRRDRIVPEDEPPSTVFYGNLGTSFLLDDYTRFPTLRETFVEVINLARVRRRNGRMEFEVFDPDDPYKVGPFSDLGPLLLVDGVLVQDHTEVLELSANNIESVHVIPKPYRYGPTAYRGIIDIKSKSGVYHFKSAGKHMQILPLESPQAPTKYVPPNYASESLERIPDYRVQLLWQPVIRFARRHVETFYASDVTGTYEVTLQGYTDDGKEVLAKRHIRVQ